MTTDTPAPPAAYRDEDLVYVDPEKRIVVGIVQWSNSGRPKSLQIEGQADDERAEKRGRRPRRQRAYPWGTYRSMKRIYKIEGKVIDTRPMLSLDEAIERCLQEPFWD
ncbi:MAG: hypothetical protein G01um101425_500 [Candidatus Peregrinibacteria bacterium Gr01-1014_25]|nr:MAG: hypothetical protein G01um101425_500 [Candidatus Peregrinibacteria bacterium Gr01-1014_25]